LNLGIKDSRTNPKHKMVFQDLPMEMPPEQGIEHVIEVKLDLTPITIKQKYKD
jgi:hypothetical protein